MATVHETDETAILGRALAPENATLSVDAARSILAIELSVDDRIHLRELAERSQAGELSSADEAALESYRHVGRILELMKSKARISLKFADQKV